MSKYEPLGAYLKSKGVEHVPMTFAEIERVVGMPLPHSKTHRAWWSNNPSNNVMTKVWLAAGYHTEQVDIDAEQLVFARTKPANGNGPVPAAAKNSGPGGGGTERNPLFGWLKGKIIVTPGIDLTKPADPSWGEQS
jgi:hypothetical protein